jgi:predicted phosphodiesterase
MLESKQLGKINGKVLIFGGVYSNYQALVALKQIAKDLEINPSHIFCNGDIVGYCSQPSECLDFVQEWGIHAIQGNVEESLLSGIDDCGCNFAIGGRCDLLSKQWFPYAASEITTSNFSYLSKLPKHISFEYMGKKVLITHGSPDDISQFIFKSTPWETKLNILNEAESDVVLAGHCGLPFVDLNKENYWINPGVIGMPANDGETNGWFLILDDFLPSLSYKFHRLNYNCEETNKLMLEKGLPEAYAKTIVTGIWDNCEILPQYESELQGETIEFSSTILNR